MQPTQFHGRDFIPVKIIFNGNFGCSGSQGASQFLCGIPFWLSLTPCFSGVWAETGGYQPF
jgi:hypothetical protein